MLVRYRADDDEAIREGQWEKLDALQTWCRGAGKPLVVEILVPRRGEPEDAFDAIGRPEMLAGFIGEAYRRALTPEFWKIEGTLSPDGARTIDAAIAANAACRQIILGKAADLSTIGRWFAAAAASPTAIGFAIGRSVFWEPSAAFLTGTSTAGRAAADICATTSNSWTPGSKAAYSRARWGICSATSATRSGPSRGSPPSPPSPS